MTRQFWRFAMLASVIMAAVPSAAQKPLIPRQALFGNPERSAAQVSPDGTRISFLAPRDGVMNVWVAPIGNLAAAKAVTDEKDRPVREYFWSQNSRTILYLEDKGGTEDFLLYASDPASGATRKLTPYEHTRVEIIGASVHHPSDILIGLNNREPKWHDVWRLDIDTGKMSLAYRNEGFGGFVPDDELNLRYAVKDQPDGGFIVEKFGADGAVRPFMTIPGDDSLTTSVSGLDVSGSTLYGVDSRGRDKAALVSFDQTTAAPTVLAQSPDADMGGAFYDPATGKVLAYSVDYLKTEWKALDPAVQPDIDFIAAHAKGQWSIESASLDGRYWIVLHDPVTEPAYYWLYDRRAKSLEKLFTIRPKLEGAPLSPMYPVVIRSRDGLNLVSYLTLPRGTATGIEARPTHPLPMVLNVHGGPWGRDDYGYDPTHQWLANRGYAVLSVNFRGSTGFGKGFINAGDRQWGRKMHDDLIDAVDWAVRNGVAQKNRIAIMGGSYGGYATLAGITMTPKEFACGVDIVGPSNLQTLLGSVPPYWASFFENLARRVGDPRTDTGKRLLAERSPLTYAGQIERPLLIGQGANDPRVKRAESDQIVAAMKAKKIPVTYILYPDEGHGFAVPANRISFDAVSEGFLAQCLGGLAEPIGDDFKGSSITVLEGGEHVPGLKEAMAAPH